MSLLRPGVVKQHKNSKRCHVLSECVIVISFFMNKLEDGCLNMVDFRSQISAMKAAWTTRNVTAPNNHLWAFLPKLYLSKYGEDFLILKTTATDKANISCVKSLPEFYQDVIISYNKSKVISYEDFCNNVLNQPIWGNKFIKFKKQNSVLQALDSSGYSVCEKFENKK